MVPNATVTTGTTSCFNSIVSLILVANLGTCLSFLVLLQWYSGLLAWWCQWLTSFLIFCLCISGCVCWITLLVWIGKSHKILHPLFSSTKSGTCSCHLSIYSRWNVLHSSQWIFFATWSCFFLVLVLCQIREGANYVWLLINPTKRIFTDLVNTSSLPLQLSFPQKLPFLTLIVAFCFPNKLHI